MWRQWTVTDRDPFGRTQRTGRLSDEQTAERMLQTGQQRVSSEGLPISFDLLRFEDLIVEAGVARSAVYRRWPTKNHFYADLLRELAASNHPAMAQYEVNTTDAVVRLLRENLERLITPQGRRALFVEISRLAALENFNSLAGSRAWSNYVTLTATLTTLPTDGGLHADLRQAMHRSDEGFFGVMASFYATMLPFMGQRLRSDLPEVTLGTLAELGAAIIEGLSLNNISNPKVGDQRMMLDPFGTGVVAEWSLPGLGFTTQLMALVEADPDQAGDWTEQMIQERGLALDQIAAAYPGD